MPGLERPWQSVWPPEDQDDLQRWLKTDSPEFINWRFDPSNFFNRPWSSYTRNEAAKTEQAYTILPPNDPVPAADAQNEAIELKMAEDHAADFLTVLCSELDKQVQDRQLPVFRGADPRLGDNPLENPLLSGSLQCNGSVLQVENGTALSNNVDDVLSKRYRLVNIWRSVPPITHQDCPLALCDYRTITKKEYISTDVIFPRCCNEGYDIQYSPAHRWFYQKGMLMDEVILFKLDDSADGVAKCVAHGAFNDPTANPGAAHRASIEVRAIIPDGN
ncbi:uncharacterized protein TrAFT101_000056 [Trichoderma asperellum]|uniref:uncharacterized protein n=1 Tax=Trichoderma asperellum TaxID=101201 RepID=UPI003330EFBB|nr:hypothetical protein TrAFT101_000056 [Trichoderma asperellum]